MLTEVQFTVQIYGQVFLKMHLSELLLQISEGCDISFILQEKLTSCTCLLGSMLKVIFRWFAQAFVFL